MASAIAIAAHWNARRSPLHTQANPRREDSAVVRAGLRGWTALDWLTAAYTLATGLLIAIRKTEIHEPARLLAAHAAILTFLLLLPAPGAAWEQPKPGESAGVFWAREVVRFFRYGYPLLLVIFFFEEVQSTVLAVWPTSGYWFEARLYAADRLLFGATPAVALAPWQQPWLDELMHFFYSTYYYIVIGGAGAAWAIGYKKNGRAPGPGYALAMTSVVAAFLCAFSCGTPGSRRGGLGRILS